VHFLAPAGLPEAPVARLNSWLYAERLWRSALRTQAMARLPGTN